MSIVDDMLRGLLVLVAVGFAAMGGAYAAGVFTPEEQTLQPVAPSVREAKNAPSRVARPSPGRHAGAHRPAERKARSPRSR